MTRTGVVRMRRQRAAYVLLPLHGVTVCKRVKRTLRFWKPHEKANDNDSLSLGSSRSLTAAVRLPNAIL